ncbi:MAG: PspC domain-containing protein [Raoultibacter sp.]
MYNDKALYRSRDGLIGGVCAGLSDYFSIDPVLIRIVMVVATLVTSGFGGIFYVVMWIILPQEAQEPAPVDVAPESVHSETYGVVAPPCVTQQPCSSVFSEGGVSGFSDAGKNVSVGTGHIPPVPPQNYAAFSCVPPAAPVVERPAEQASSRDSARIMLWFGFFLLFFGLAALLGNAVEGVTGWRFWPLLPIIVGIAYMVIPGKKKSRVSQFTAGLILFSCGVVALLISLGIVSFGSIYSMLDALWPLLMIMTGFFVLASALKSPAFTLLAGSVFVAFCAVGLIWFAEPGLTEYIAVQFPFSHFVIANPWM